MDELEAFVLAANKSKATATKIKQRATQIVALAEARGVDLGGPRGPGILRSITDLALHPDQTQALGWMERFCEAKREPQRMDVNRETGDKALSKRVEACFMESTVGDEAARKALYESIYVAKVLRLYGTFRPQDLMILRSEDLSTDNASFTRHWLNKAEAHLNACSYKLTAKPMSAVDQALSAPSQPLYEAFEPWNKKLSELLGREMRWSTLLSESVPSAVAVSALDDGDSLLKQSTATAEKADAEAAAVAPPAEEEKKPEAPTTPEDRMLELIAGSPVMIFSKSYCPYSRRAKSIMAAGEQHLVGQGQMPGNAKEP